MLALLLTPPPSAAEVVIFAAAEALIAADAWQTLDLKHHPNLREDNPLLGAHPSDARIVGWSLVAGFSVAAGFLLLPRPWRNAVTLPVLFIEVPNLVKNAAMGLVIRF